MLVKYEMAKELTHNSLITLPIYKGYTIEFFRIESFRMRGFCFHAHPKNDSRLLIQRFSFIDIPDPTNEYDYVRWYMDTLNEIKRIIDRSLKENANKIVQ